MHPPAPQHETRQRWSVEEIRRDAARLRRQPPAPRPETQSPAVKGETDDDRIPVMGNEDVLAGPWSDEDAGSEESL